MRRSRQIKRSHCIIALRKSKSLHQQRIDYRQVIAALRMQLAAQEAELQRMHAFDPRRAGKDRERVVLAVRFAGVDRQFLSTIWCGYHALRWRSCARFC